MPRGFNSPSLGFLCHFSRGYERDLFELPQIYGGTSHRSRQSVIAYRLQSFQPAVDSLDGARVHCFRHYSECRFGRLSGNESSIGGDARIAASSTSTTWWIAWDWRLTLWTGCRYEECFSARRRRCPPISVGRNRRVVRVINACSLTPWSTGTVCIRFLIEPRYSSATSYLHSPWLVPTMSCRTYTNAERKMMALVLWQPVMRYYMIGKVVKIVRVCVRVGSPFVSPIWTVLDVKKCCCGHLDSSMVFCCWCCRCTTIFPESPLFPWTGPSSSTLVRE